jgi:hypothetical protein
MDARKRVMAARRSMDVSSRATCVRKSWRRRRGR